MTKETLTEDWLSVSPVRHLAETEAVCYSLIEFLDARSTYVTSSARRTGVLDTLVGFWCSRAVFMWCFVLCQFLLPPFWFVKFEDQVPKFYELLARCRYKSEVYFPTVRLLV
jgi:hypothetical protein